MTMHDECVNVHVCLLIVLLINRPILSKTKYQLRDLRTVAT